MNKIIVTGIFLLLFSGIDTHNVYAQFSNPVQGGSSSVGSGSSAGGSNPWGLGDRALMSWRLGCGLKPDGTPSGLYGRVTSDLINDCCRTLGAEFADTLGTYISDGRVVRLCQKNDDGTYNGQGWRPACQPTFFCCTRNGIGKVRESSAQLGDGMTQICIGNIQCLQGETYKPAINFSKVAATNACRQGTKSPSIWSNTRNENKGNENTGNENTRNENTRNENTRNEWVVGTAKRKEEEGGSRAQLFLNLKKLNKPN